MRFKNAIGRYRKPGGVAVAPAPTPSPTPTPTPVTNMVIEGDSITATFPDSNSTPQAGDATGSFAFRYRATTSGIAVRIRAEASRVIGQLANLNDGGNELMGHVAEDIAYGPQLIGYKIGANDMGASRTYTQYKGDLTLLYSYYHAAGIKVWWSPPLPYNPDGSVGGSYTFFTTQRTGLMADARDPAVWSAWCDYYVSLGEYPDFADPTLGPPLFVGGGGVHPDAEGHRLLATAFIPAMNTLVDLTRATSTQMYDAAWPVSETNLAVSTTITRRFIVSGLAHKGIALTGGNALGVTGATIRLNSNGSYGTSITGWLYNGDVIDLQVATSASNSTNTSVSLTIGSETRSLTYRTVASVTAATYVHGAVSVLNSNVTTHTHTITVSDTGLLVLGLAGRNPGPTSVTLYPTGSGTGGVTATEQWNEGAYSQLGAYTVPVTPGTWDVKVVYAAAHDQTALSWGVAKDAEYLSSVHIDLDNQSGPFATPNVTIPASGLFIAFCEFDGGTSATPWPVNVVTGTTSIDSGYGEANFERFGLTVAKRTTSGAGQSVTFGNSGNFSGPQIGGIVFKAAGT